MGEDEEGEELGDEAAGEDEEGEDVGPEEAAGDNEEVGEEAAAGEGEEGPRPAAASSRGARRAVGYIGPWRGSWAVSQLRKRGGSDGSPKASGEEWLWW